MSDATVRIRRAEPRDIPELGRLGAILVRTHHEFDPRRFMGPERERDYPAFMTEQLAADDAAVLVAEDAEGILGYVFAAIEPSSLKELREEAGYIHDVVVDERARSRGVASRLVALAMDWLERRQVPRVLLWTAPQNETAQRLFARLGFRRTMIEFTKELRR
jgi:ribosomal protein S18 acetylase RimI-like enzyme